MSELSPVVIFVYNRLEHTKNLLNSLEKCYLSQETVLYIFSDGCKHDRKTAQNRVDEVRCYLREYRNNHQFKQIIYVEAETNKGLAKSIIAGVSEVINQHGKVIVLEDDLVVSRDFLLYMNEGLVFYANNPRIWSVSGYTDPLITIKKYPHDIYATLRANSWGWGTWKSRWDLVDWKINDYKLFKYNIIARKLFNQGGNDRCKLLDRQMTGEIDSWAIRWDYAAFKLRVITIRPIETRVICHGFDGSGVHCCADSIKQGELYAGKRKCRFENLRIDKFIKKEFMKYHSTDLMK